MIFPSSACSVVIQSYEDTLAQRGDNLVAVLGLCARPKFLLTAHFQVSYCALVTKLSSPFSPFPPPACGPGTFKSKQGESLCSPCPPNSRTNAGGATLCTCRGSYFRADTDPPDSACTSKSAFGSF